MNNEVAPWQIRDETIQSTWLPRMNSKSKTLKGSTMTILSYYTHIFFFALHLVQGLAVAQAPQQNVTTVVNATRQTTRRKLGTKIE